MTRNAIQLAQAVDYLASNRAGGLARFRTRGRYASVRDRYRAFYSRYALARARGMS